MNEVCELRIKDGRCQRLIQISHEFADNSGGMYKIKRVWRDLERLILETRLSSEQFGFQPLSRLCFNYEIIPDTVEVDYQ